MRVLVLGSGVIGTTSAYYLARAGFQVTVVGEVPEPTARMIGDSVRPLALDSGKP